MDIDAFKEQVALTVCHVLDCNVMVKSYVPDTEMILCVSRDGSPTYETVRAPLAPGMGPEEITEAVVQHVMVAMPLNDCSAVQTCNHQWTRSNLASGPEGYVAQCAKCLRMADYRTANRTYELWQN